MTDTSNNVSARVMQKNLFLHRLWVCAITLLAFFLYYIAFTALTLAGLKSDPTVTATQMHQELSSLFVTEGATVTGILTTILAAISGIQGFLWLDIKNEVTFFESLPISRTRRFWNIVLNSFIVYIVSYFVMLVIGLLLAFGFAGNLVPVGQALSVFVQNLFLFFAVYTSAVLATMLTGNLFVAVLAEMVFLGFVPILDIVLEGFRSSMFRTYTSRGTTAWTHLFSPLATLTYHGSLKSLFPNLLDGLICLVLAFWVYRFHRQSEDAGKSVLHRPVQWAAKIAVSAEAALAAGLIAGTSVGDSISFPVAVITIILTSVIVSGIMEAIYTRNIKSIFRHFPAALIAGAGAILIFSGYRFDWSGYDSWQPKAADVRSAYLYDSDNYYSGYYLENGKGAGIPKSTGEPSAFYRRYMRLTDIDDVNAILKAGQENIDGNSGKVITLIIGYRMKNGKTQTRHIDLPVNDNNTALMDKVIGTEQFHQGYFQIYHDNFVERDLQHVKLSYWNGSDLYNPNQVTDVRKLYADLRKAYLKDLTKFDFTLASKGKLIGQVEIEKASSDSKTGYFDLTYPVYSTYTNTITFLKDNGLYQPVASKKELSKYNPIQGPFAVG